MQGYRNFCTKLWNAARFCELQRCELDPAFEPGACRQIVNRWALGKLAQAAARARASLEGYRFNEAASALYRFTWDEFCDWYVELAKPLLAGSDEAARAETRACRRLDPGAAAAPPASADARSSPRSSGSAATARRAGC